MQQPSATPEVQAFHLGFRYGGADLLRQRWHDVFVEQQPEHQAGNGAECRPGSSLRSASASSWLSCAATCSLISCGNAAA